MSEIRVGLLGYGNAGRIFHAPLIMSEPRMTLCQIGSRTFSNKALPSGVSGAPIGKVLENPDIDLVVVATPNGSHASLAKQAVLNGKHVVVDKPFALNAEEAAEVVQLADEHQKLLSVFQNRRWDGGFLTARDAMETGELGPVSYGEFHFDRFSPDIKDRWREWDTPGAGILYDLGPHLLDQVYCLFGMPDALTANVARQRPGAIVEDFFHIIHEFGATRVVVHASSLMPDHAPRIALYGERASFFQFGFDGQEEALKAGNCPGSPDWGKTPDGQAYFLDADGSQHDTPLSLGRYEAFYAGIANAIINGTRPDVASSQALDVMRILDAAALSARTGRRIALKTTPE